MHRYKTDSAKIGKSSFHFAWVLDEGQEERVRGVTIDVGMKDFETEKRTVTLLDAPGHRDFISSMITGVASADAAVLTVDSGTGAFESGFGFGGQTKQHAILARALGVLQIVVAINKLDRVDWNFERYQRIAEEVVSFLEGVGYKKSNIWVLPISGLHGTNLTERSSDENLKWYKGPCLIEIIELLRTPVKPLNKPLRFCITDAYKQSAGELLGFCVMGKVVGGVLEKGNKLRLIPGDEHVTIKGIRGGGERATSGQTVELAVNLPPAIEWEDVGKGMILCHPEYPMPYVREFRAKVTTFELERPLLKGHACQLFAHVMRTPAKLLKIEKRVDLKGKEFKNPKCLLSNQIAFIIVQAVEPIFIEHKDNFKSLGRIALRDHKLTLAAGEVVDLLK